MAYPPYVLTRPVSVGGSMTLEGAETLRIKVTITSTRSLVWDATGYRFESRPVSVTSEPGAEASLPLPRTDVVGWRDGRTGALIDLSAPDSHSHTYNALVEFLKADGTSAGIAPVKHDGWVLPEGDGSAVDLDKTIPVGTVSGQVLSVPDSWSLLVASAEASAAEAAASLALIGTPDVEASADSIPKRTATGALAVGEPTEPDHTVQRRGLDATSAALSGNLARLAGKIERAAEDATVLVVSDSTGAGPTAWVEKLAAALGAAHPELTVTMRSWNVTTSAYAAPVDVQTGTGPRSVHFYNAAAPGETTWYFLGAKWAAAVLATPDPDVVLVNMGHNEGSSAGGTTPAMWRGQYITLTESLTEAHPEAGLVCILQNPEIGNLDAQVRARVYEDVASQRGYGVLDVLGTFLRSGAWDTTLMADAVHPNAAGYALWAGATLAAIEAARTARAVSATPSSLLTYGAQMLPNGTFASWTAALPDGLQASGATATKDTTNYESTNGYAMRVQATGAAASRVFGQLSAAQVRPLRGQWVTLAVRLRVPPGAANTVGRISLHDGVQSETRSRAMQSPPTAAFVWRILSIKVSPSAAWLQASVYADTASNATADVTVDAMHLVRGVLPRRSIG